jgi:transcriptional regulator with XRE-family HTH domain
MDNTFTMLVGYWLKLSRKEKGIAQSSVATALGIAQSTLSKMEIGKSAMSITQFMKYCETINVGPRTVMGLAIDEYQLRKVLVLRADIFYCEGCPERFTNYHEATKHECGNRSIKTDYSYIHTGVKTNVS